MTVKSLLKEAKKMDIDDRTVLGHMILKSVQEECDDAPLSEELKAELNKRLDAIEKNPSLGSSWEDVKKRLNRKLRDARKRR